MSNTIIFKGISSENFSNVIISELPPLIIPPHRFEKIEIDGADGDIIIDKGYSAIDLPVKISITNPMANMDNIFSWLRGKGNLTLSTYANWYYKAEIIDEINFERLLRYRTATVKFHCQPFRYLLNDTISMTADEVTPYLTEYYPLVLNTGNVVGKPIITIETDNGGCPESGITQIKIGTYGNYYNYYVSPAFSQGIKIDCEKKKIYTKSLGTWDEGGVRITEFPEIPANSELNIHSNHTKITKITVENGSRWI